MMRKIFIPGLIMFLLLAGCQPTPSDDVIVDKSSQTVCPSELGPTQTTPSASPEIPVVEPLTPNAALNETQWKETIQGKKPSISFEVDAIVQTPIMDNFPILKMLPIPFSEERIGSYCDILFDGRLAYEYDKNERYTIDDAGRLHQLINSRNIENDRIVDQRQEEVKMLLTSAVSKRQKLISSLKLKEEQGLENLSILSVMNDDDGYLSRVIIQNDSESLSTSLTYYRDYNFAEYNGRNAKPSGNPRGMTTSQSDALSIAINMLKALNISNMAMSSKQLWTKATLLEDYKSLQYNDLSDQCYAFFFSRVIGKSGTVTVAQSFDSPASYGYDGKTYDAVWEEELVVVCVDDEGVAYLKWTSPCMVEEIITEDAGILSEEEIRERFRQQIVLANIDIGNNASSTIHVDKVVLGYTYIKARSERGAYLLVPVWDFFGRRIISWSDAEGLHEEIDTPENHSLMTINATDSSIIDRGVGY